MKKKPITIKELASKLNISVSTVSRALRNASDVNPQTKAAVQRLAGELNYVPNYFAQNLVTKQSRILGVILPLLQNHHYAQLVRGMLDKAHELHYYLMLGQSNESHSRELSCLRKMTALPVDGLLLCVSQETSECYEFEVARHKGIPIVLFDRPLPGFACGRVMNDDREGAFMAVEHLVEAGCRHIAHLAGPLPNAAHAKRRQGYLKALQKNGLPADGSLVVPYPKTDQELSRALHQLFRLNPTPDGIFAFEDNIAARTLQIIKNEEITVPPHFRIVGFNDEPLCSFTCPTLSSIRPSSYEAGRYAVGMLIEEIRSKQPSSAMHLLSPTLVVRESSTHDWASGIMARQGKNR